MKNLIARQFSANARQLRSRLTILWLILPFGLFGNAILTLRMDELSVASALIALAFCLPYYLLTGLFCYRMWQSYSLNPSRSIAQLFLAVSTVIAVTGWLYLNCRPRRTIMADGVNDNSPFSQIWYYWDQTRYGYPFPFLRFFDRPLDNSVTHIYDADGLFFNILFLCFVTYTLATIISLIWKLSNVPREAAGVAK